MRSWTIRLLISKLEINDSVELTGGIPYLDVIHELKTCDIFVFPSKGEMMPRAVIEAMVIGVPVVASGVDGIIDLIQDGQTGLIVKPGDVSGLAESICNLLENPDFAKNNFAVLTLIQMNSRIF